MYSTARIPLLQGQEESSAPTSVLRDDQAVNSDHPERDVGDATNGSGNPGGTDSGDNLEVPIASIIDRTRDFVLSMAALDPTGIGEAALGLLDAFIPRALERRTRAFNLKVAARIAVLARRLDDVQEHMVTAAWSEGVLAAARSASPQHLEYLANASARAAATEDERDNDFAMVLLRLAGDLTATHIRVLGMYSDESALSRWIPEEGGRYRIRALIEAEDPALAADEEIVRAVLGDLERFGLTGDMAGIDFPDAGGSFEATPKVVGPLGHRLLAFIAPVDESTP
jgi:hypothetical protein